LGSAPAASTQHQSSSLAIHIDDPALKPLAVGNVTLPTRNTLQVVSVDQEDFQPSRFEDLEERNPVHPGGLHRDSANTAPLKPIGRGMQITGEASEPAYGLLVTVSRNSQADFFCSDVDSGSIGL